MDLLVLFAILYVLSLSCLVAYTCKLSLAKLNLLGLGLSFWVSVQLIQTLNRL